MKKTLGLLIDLSGTIHVENSAISGAIKAVQKLKDNGIPYLFVSNTSKESRASIRERLLNIGFHPESVCLNKIFTSLSAGSAFIRTLNQPVYPILTESAMQEMPPDLVCREHNSTQRIVAVGLADDEFNYRNLNYAFRLLMEPSCSLVAMNKGRYHQTSSGLSLGPGGFVEGLEFASGKKATVVGKPSKAFFEHAAKLLNLSTHDCAMIGDDVRDDVIGALDAGVGFGVLVQTGKFRPGDEKHLHDSSHSESQFCITASFSEVVDMFLEQKSSDAY